MSDPKLQAFLEDLVAVFAKNDTRISSGYDYPCVQEFYGYERFVVITSSHDICFLEDAPTGTVQLRHLACAEIPTTAHGRLQAAARVAALRDEVAP